jgi:hypothetical protein
MNIRRNSNRLLQLKLNKKEKQKKIRRIYEAILKNAPCKTNEA